MIFRPAEYLFMDSVSPGSSKNYYVCSHYPDCDAYMACDDKFELKGRSEERRVGKECRL